ncbi:MAG TPA: cytochrome c oxidase subunit II [Gaiellaceae bacterium]|nr:cytochrome c oxidase subunit II [Gaiellaceae bacterium]
MRPLAALSAAVLVALASAAAALAQGTRGGFAPLEPQSTGAERIDDLYWFLVAITTFVLLLVMVPLLVFVVRFRSRGRPRTVEGPQIRGNTAYEIAWTLVPVALVALTVGFTIYKVPGIVDPSPGEEQTVVRVEGRQFYWQFEYENGVIAIDRLRLPVGRTTLLRLTAPDGDVIHSFWAPALMGKQDTIPGQLTRLRIEPTREGTYRLFCGEFCGIQHTAMRGEVEVLSQQEFEQWLEQERRTQEEQPISLGGAIWTGVCAKCHDPELDLGPPLEGNPILNDPRAVELVVRRGRGAMPGVGQRWSEEQMEALQVFLETTLAPRREEDGDDGDG